MNTQIKLRLGALALVLSPLTSHFSPCLAQGSLTPPGAPAPTMKTLDQVEPRTPISSVPLSITNPGAYYLTTNAVTSSGYAILIATNNVTLDLNGFTISSSASGSSGIAIWLNGGNSDIAIFNGRIKSGVTNNGSGVYSGPGFVNGILCSGTTPQNVRVSGITVSGVLSSGIYLPGGNSTRVENCEVRGVGGNGIVASSILDSTAQDCGGDAVSASMTANNCYGASTGNGDGVSCSGTAENCRGDSANGTGVSASVANNCYGASTGSGDGVSGSIVSSCHGESSGGNGVTAYTASNCGGSTSAGGDGISTTAASNCVGTCSGSGYGIHATYVAIGCYGSSTTGTGLYAYDAAFSIGASSSATAIQATIANGCIATGGTNNITFKYNMP